MSLAYEQRAALLRGVLTATLWHFSATWSKHGTFVLGGRLCLTRFHVSASVVLVVNT